MCSERVEGMRTASFGGGCGRSIVLGAAAAMFLASAAAAQHGVSIGKSCMPNRCVGETVDCVIQIGHNDSFGDTLEILEAWDVIDPDGAAVRVPAVGNLPIVMISGNTTCTVAGPLPCLICPGGVTCGGNPPISANQGVVQFQQNQYVIQPGDPMPLENQANIRIRDLCDGCGTPPCPGCSSTPSRLQFTAATSILTCDDGNDCTTDTCANQMCTLTPDCTMNADCDDMDPCTVDVCTVDGCCENTPLCTTAMDCDDMNACTDDACVLGCCENICREPSITCPGNQVFECDAVGDFGDPTVMDDCSVMPDVECTEQSVPGDLPQEETITRTCTVTNDCGNSDECMHTIEIVDTTPPDIECPPDLEFECDAVGDFGEPVVSDNCDPEPDVEVEVEQTINDCAQPRGVTAGISPPPKLIITRTFTADDDAVTRGANVVTCEQIINIYDTTPPLQTACPAPLALCPGEDVPFVPPTCDDACGDCSVTCLRSDGQPLNAPMPNESITITCFSTDECNNASAPCDTEVTRRSDCGEQIPTMSEWGLVVLALMLLIGGKVYFARRPELV